MKVRIQNDGGPGYQTKITSVATGEKLEYITKIDIHLEASGEVPKVLMTQLYPVIDIVADADMKQVCPLCGQATHKEPSKVSEQ